MNPVETVTPEQIGIRSRETSSSAADVRLEIYSDNGKASTVALNGSIHIQEAEQDLEEYIPVSRSDRRDNGSVFNLIYDAASNEIIYDRNALLLGRSRSEEREKLKDHIKGELVMLLLHYSMECDTVSPSEVRIHKIANEYSMSFLGEILQAIVLEYPENSNILAGICVALEGFDAKEVYPWGQTIFMNLVHHKSDMVKERIISLFENWEDRSLLPSLKNVEISSNWMREYFEDVISSFEGQECTT